VGFSACRFAQNPSFYHLRGDKSDKSGAKVVTIDRKTLGVVTTDTKMTARPGRLRRQVLQKLTVVLVVRLGLHR
jgi:hypothetical protein